MSLRTDLKDAIDEVTQPAPALESRVSALVLADGKDRRVALRARRRSAWKYRFRPAFALVAAAVVVALMAGLVIGGRMARDSANGESGQAFSVNQSELHSLESRPLALPEVQPGAPCPYTANSDPLGARLTGDGPVYRIRVSTVGRTGRGDWFGPTFYYQAKVPGMVLVRGRDLVTGQPLVFAQYSVGPSGAIATGPALGTDRLNGKTIQLHSEAVLPDPWHTQVNEELIAMFAVPIPTLCWGLQFDGPGFTEPYVNGWDAPADKGI